MHKTMLRARYRRIILFFARVVAGLFWTELVLSRLGLRGWVRRTRSERLRRIAAEFRQLAIAMGGVMIKVGQFLSARSQTVIMYPKWTFPRYGVRFFETCWLISKPRSSITRIV